MTRWLLASAAGATAGLVVLALWAADWWGRPTPRWLLVGLAWLAAASAPSYLYIR